jgi:hypothetical protein
MRNARGVNTLGHLMAMSFKKHLAKATSGVFQNKDKLTNKNERDSVWGLRNSSNNPK